ncbi:energy-coupling factor transporter transmembrane component T family protein [Rummeliibacillus pycnus]|uniref:energy-coupling factor transporter transmembrane component T family protein n=1 Tax=Rummeliibacillus pycnus TaxID=101070 RepID=UPI003D292AA5
MSNSILIGQYFDTTSIIHRLDPRTKIICTSVIMLSFITLETITSYIVATLLVFLLLRVSKVPLTIFLKGLKPLLFILSFTFLYHLFLTKGSVIWSWSFIHITSEGIIQGIHFVWRIILLVLVASFLTLTTKPLSLAAGLEKLLMPLSKLNIPVEQLSLMIVIAIRFIPTILQELERILLAQKARGYDIRVLPIHKRLFAYIPMLIPLLFTTVQRAEQLTYAIDARAYGNGKDRTHYIKLQFQKIDFQIIISTLLIALTLLLLKIGGI